MQFRILFSSYVFNMITYMTFGLPRPSYQYFMHVSIMLIADARSLFFLYIVLHMKGIFLLRLRIEKWMTKQVKELKFKMRFYLNRKRQKNKIKGKNKRNWTSFYHRNSRPLARLLPPPATHVRNWWTRLRVLKPPVKVLVNCTPACEWRRSNSFHRIQEPW
jgi:hypothetical protein